MSEQCRPTELQRALARNDVEQLRTDLAEYYKWHLWHRAGRDQNVLDEDQGMPADSLYYDRDGRLAMCVLGMAEYDDPSFLGLLAAGALEDALDTHPADEPVSDEFLDRVVEEARQTARFHWMLSGVWDYNFEPHIAQAVRDAVGDAKLEDPLPPRPLA